MRLSFAVVALSAATAVTAVGKATVKNSCGFPVYLWSVGSQVSDKGAIQPGKSYSEVYERDPVTGGRSLKITTVKDGLYNGAPQTNFAYTLDPSQVWYDLSDVFGDAFAGHKLAVVPNNANCQSIVWPNGVPPAGSQVKVCTSSADVTLTLCA
ncbi:probable BYS1 domain protein [Cephalotrichum gorgonifer]|uniref:Probable BYS1 domain protein n=1 Tax=Cephalotrichum gorgonifer TaxID=2041049 RepID=A0AAE8N5S6_9PEZI|nr:probable BYS1 domain protein [Cephalotrichum gorgonifer]